MKKPLTDKAKSLYHDWVVFKWRTCPKCECEFEYPDLPEAGPSVCYDCLLKSIFGE